MTPPFPRRSRWPWMPLLACLATPAWAQTPSSPPAPADASASAPAAARVRVAGFKVDGNTLLPPGRIDAALAPFTGERTAAELNQAAAAVQALYAQAGYGGVVAFLPPQSSTDGTVAITVVEGKLARVQVDGARQFSAGNVRAALPALVPGRTPRLPEIDTQIQMSNENPAKQVQVLLQPGAGPGETDARIAVTEEPVQRWTATLDNRGNDSTGRLRASLGWQHANIGGRDDVLSLLAQTAPDEPDAVKVLSGSYRLPLYAQQLFLDAYAAWSDVDGGTTSTVVGDLSFAGRGRLAGVRATRLLPRWGEADQRVALGLDYRAYLNSCEIAGLPPGACGPAGESISVQPISLEYTLRRLGGTVPVGIVIGLHHNLQVGGGRSDDDRFEAVREGAKPRYTLLRGSLFAAASPAEGWDLQFQANGQFTGDALVPGEQFGVGGAGSVRGYQERELAGDRGVQASVEWIGPQLLAGNERTLRALVFADAGWVGNRRGTPCLGQKDECTLGSLGLGLRGSAGRLQAHLYVAQALKTALRTDRNDIRAHVGVSYSF
ncbi:ShlB/FhaC/HecB family hemolysin secretion/activation protein [Aquincola sp. MAHUQ-54]|uniref:ShlB/FhaC/HecB family hemolysin secretion/activation protein n=1 Tax=Aquincola agrisoli TaxID=3119538 RepID=A0AAW9QGB2_9BURK